MKRLTAFCIFFYALMASAQGSYISELETKMKSVSDRKKIDLIHNIPFQEMNSRQLETIKFYEKSLELAEKLKDADLIAESYNRLSLVHYYNGNYELSTRYLLQAIDYFEKTKNLRKLGNAYAQYGHQIKRKNLPKGIQMMRKGIDYLAQVDDTLALSSAYNNFGVLHQMNNDLDSALHYFFKGLKIVEDRKDSLGIPYSLNNIAIAYMELNDFEKARKYYDEAFKIRKLRNDLNGIAENYHYSGELYLKLENYMNAVIDLKKAYDICLEMDYKYLRQLSAELLAEAYEKMGDYQSAYEYQSIAQEINDELLNEASMKAISQLEIQFETEKKNKELAESKVLLREKSIKESRQFYLLLALGVLVLFIILIAVIVIRQQRYKQLKLKEENVLKDKLADERMKNQLHEERLRISRDLHDNIGSQLTFITSSMDNLKYVATENNVNTKLTELTDFTRTTISKLRDTIWAMNKESITINDFRGRIYNYIDGVKKLMPTIFFKLETDLEFSKLEFTSTQGIYLFRITQEAINNSLKYAKPTLIEISFHEIDDYLQFIIRDNGDGFDLETTPNGNGLNNMRHRAEEIGAIVSVSSTIGEGTKVEVRISKNKLNGVLLDEEF